MEVDVKNPDSPAPYAFIHYADMDSVVRAIRENQQHPQPGKPRFKVDQNSTVAAIPRSQTSAAKW